MRRLLLLSGLLLAWPLASSAQCPGVTTQLTPYASEQLTIADTAKTLTASIYKPAGTLPSMALISVEGGTIRYLVVGTPTASSGHPITGAPPQTVVICGLDSIAAFRAIRQSTDASLTATYYRAKTP